VPKTTDKTEGTERRHTQTSEANAYVGALHHEFADQVKRYHNLTGNLLDLEARVELAEKQLCLTRDHLAMVIQKTEGAVPHEWKKISDTVRFVGVRLADACVALLKEHKKMTPQELLDALNNGMYRFRTSSPFREIHGALLRQRYVKRTEDDAWAWEGPEEDQLRLTLLRPDRAKKKEA